MIRTSKQIIFRFIEAGIELVSNSKIMTLMVMPYLLGFGAFFVFLIVGVFNTGLIESGLLAGARLPEGWGTLISYIAIPVLAIFGAVMVTLGAFQLVLERLLNNVLKKKGYRIKKSLTPWKSFWRIALEVVIRIIFLIVLLSFVLGTLLVPLLNVITITLGAIYLGCDITGMCFSALRIPVGRQFALIRRHIGVISEIGICTTGLVMIPVLGLFLFPISFVVVAESIGEWIEAGDSDILERVESI